MLDLVEKYATDHHKEVDGTWVTLGGEGRILLARIGNVNWQDALKKVPTNLRAQMESGKLDSRVTEGIIAKLLANTVLLDWEGLAEGEVEVPYSKENALRLLTELKDFRDMVFEYAGDIENFRHEKLEEDAKNSESGSSGT